MWTTTWRVSQNRNANLIGWVAVHILTNKNTQSYTCCKQREHVGTTFFREGHNYTSTAINTLGYTLPLQDAVWPLHVIQCGRYNGGHHLVLVALVLGPSPPPLPLLPIFSLALPYLPFGCDHEILRAIDSSKGRTIYNWSWILCGKVLRVQCWDIQWPWVIIPNFIL